uniref:Cell adhesion molecule 2 n=2 Tax=Lygus hesperus TaxID=30085 RepID=A0A0A9YJJ0_LYGHE
MNNEAMGSTTAIIVAIFFLVTGSTCLKLVRLNVPPYKMRGELAILECLYELEGDNLYAVKWYKENEEFYRYVPKSEPKILSYRVEGIKVDHSLSDSKQVALRGVNLKSSGIYRCEVSAEAPSFASAHREARMEVIFLPSHGPHIAGSGKQYYMIGDEINLNCTSAKSYPASVLHWFINDQQVSDTEGLVRYPHVVHTHGLITTILGLRTTVAPQHFIGGSMKLKCVASLSPVLWQGEGESIVQSMSPLLDNREAMLLVKGEAIRNMITVPLLVITILLAFLRS